MSGKDVLSRLKEELTCPLWDCILGTLEGPGINTSRCAVCQEPVWRKDLHCKPLYQNLTQALLPLLRQASIETQGPQCISSVGSIPFAGAGVALPHPQGALGAAARNPEALPQSRSPPPQTGRRKRRKTHPGVASPVQRVMTPCAVPDTAHYESARGRPPSPTARKLPSAAAARGSVPKLPNQSTRRITSTDRPQRHQRVPQGAPLHAVAGQEQGRSLQVPVRGMSLPPAQVRGGGSPALDSCLHRSPALDNCRQRSPGRPQASASMVIEDSQPDDPPVPRRQDAASTPCSRRTTTHEDLPAAAAPAPCNSGAVVGSERQPMQALGLAETGRAVPSTAPLRRGRLHFDYPPGIKRASGEHPHGPALPSGDLLRVPPGANLAASGTGEAGGRQSVGLEGLRIAGHGPEEETGTAEGKDHRDGPRLSHPRRGLVAASKRSKRSGLEPRIPLEDTPKDCNPDLRVRLPSSATISNPVPRVPVEAGAPRPGSGVLRSSTCPCPSDQEKRPRGLDPGIRPVSSSRNPGPVPQPAGPARAGKRGSHSAMRGLSHPSSPGAGPRDARTSTGVAAPCVPPGVLSSLRNPSHSPGDRQNRSRPLEGAHRHHTHAAVQDRAMAPDASPVPPSTRDKTAEKEGPRWDPGAAEFSQVMPLRPKRRPRRATWPHPGGPLIRKPAIPTPATPQPGSVADQRDAKTTIPAHDLGSKAVHESAHRDTTSRQEVRAGVAGEGGAGDGLQKVDACQVQGASGGAVQDQRDATSEGRHSSRHDTRLRTRCGGEGNGTKERVGRDLIADPTVHDVPRVTHDKRTCTAGTVAPLPAAATARGGSGVRNLRKGGRPSEDAPARGDLLDRAREGRHRDEAASSCRASMAEGGQVSNHCGADWLTRFVQGAQLGSLSLSPDLDGAPPAELPRQALDVPEPDVDARLADVHESDLDAQLRVPGSGGSCEDSAKQPCRGSSGAQPSGGVLDTDKGTGLRPSTSGDRDPAPGSAFGEIEGHGAPIKVIDAVVTSVEGVAVHGAALKEQVGGPSASLVEVAIRGPSRTGFAGHSTSSDGVARRGTSSNGVAKAREVEAPPITGRLCLGASDVASSESSLDLSCDVASSGSSLDLSCDVASSDSSLDLSCDVASPESSMDISCGVASPESSLDLSCDVASPGRSLDLSDGVEVPVEVEEPCTIEEESEIALTAGVEVEVEVEQPSQFLVQSPKVSENAKLSQNLSQGFCQETALYFPAVAAGGGAIKHEESTVAALTMSPSSQTEPSPSPAPGSSCRGATPMCKGPEQVFLFKASKIQQVLQREDPATEELPDLSLEVVCLEWAVEKLRQQGQAARQLALLLEEATVASPVSADKRTLADIDAALRARGIQAVADLVNGAVAKEGLDRQEFANVRGHLMPV